MTERLQVVDENDQPVRIATREEAWANGWILRHVYIVLRDADGNFLLQQRSMKKKSNPGKWTWAATGHVDESETYEQAAPRELFEEIGIADVAFERIGKLRTTHPNNHGIVDCFITVFIGTIARDTPITIDPEEVETTRWFSPLELHELMSDPANVTHNSRVTYQQFFAQSSTAINLATAYFTASNRSDLAKIAGFFTDTSTYSSVSTGIYLGANDIISMQKEFHRSFASLQWNIDSIAEVRPNIVRINYTFKGTKNSGETISVTGIEHIIVVDDKIQHIEIRSNQ